MFSESKNSGGQVPRNKIGAVSLYGVLTRVCIRKPSRPSGLLPTGKISFALRLNCKAAQEEVKWNRKLTYPLRKRGDRLNSEELERLKKFFENNPAIKLAYEFKERLCELLNRKHQTAKECKRNIRELKTMMKQMKYEATQEFERLAETISDWFTPIIRMWRFTQNNGITEGFHRKMKLIQRMAYGYRNFQNYRLRVLVLCGVFH